MLLKDEDAGVRLAAAQALKQLRPGAVGQCGVLAHLRRLSKQDPSPKVRAAAGQAVNWLERTRPR